MSKNNLLRKDLRKKAATRNNQLRKLEKLKGTLSILET